MPVMRDIYTKKDMRRYWQYK